MTNESISGFLNSIAEAKRAFDAEPSYQSQIRDLENDKRRLGDTVAQRELRIHDLKHACDELQAKLRSVEAERDDAGFRAIQEADKVSSLLVTLRGFINDGLKVLSAVQGEEQTMIAQSVLEATHNELSKVRKENDNLAFEVALKEEELQRLQDEMRRATEQLQRPLASQGAAALPSSQGEGTDPSSRHDMFPEPEYYNKGVSETIPTASVSDPIPQGLGNEPSPFVSVAGNNETVKQTEPSIVASGEGQSEGPFAAQAQSQPESQTVGLDTATNETSAASNASPPERNRDRSTFFKGRKYFDVTYFVPLHQWLNDGGSREDYYWRPAEANVPLPEANRASHQS